MTIQTQPIVIDPASIVAVGEAKAARRGRPKKGVVIENVVKVRAYSLSDDAHSAVAQAAAALGVSESAVMEALAKALMGRFQSAQ